MLAHLKDLAEEGPYRQVPTLGAIARAASQLRYEGGGREAVLDKVEQVCARDGLEGYNHNQLASLVESFEMAGRDLGPAMRQLIKAREEELDRIEEAAREAEREAEREAYVKAERREGVKAERREEVKEERREEPQPTEVDVLAAAAKPGNAANTVKLMGRLGARPRDATLRLLCERLEAAGVEQLAPREVRLLLDIFSRWRCSPGAALLTPLCQVMLETELHGWDAKQAGILLHRLTLSRFNPGPALLDLIAARLEAEVLGELDPSMLCRMVYDLASMSHPVGLPVLEQIYGRVAPGLSELGLQSQVQLVGGLVKLSYHPGDAVVQQVAKACVKQRFRGLNDDHLGSLLHGLANCNHRVDEAFLREFYAYAAQLGWMRLPRHVRQLTLRSLVVMDVPVEEGLLRAIVEELEGLAGVAERAWMEGGPRKGVWNKKPVVMLSRAVRVYLYLNADGSEVFEQLEEALHRLAVASAAVERRPAAAPSKTQEPSSVSETYTTLDVELRSRYELEEDRTVDVVVADYMIRLPSGLKVAVWLHDPSQFFANIDEPTGQTILKRRLLDEAVRRGVIHSWVWVRGCEDSILEKIDEAVRLAQDSKHVNRRLRVTSRSTHT
jgi:hypothetical protein